MGQNNETSFYTCVCVWLFGMLSINVWNLFFFLSQALTQQAVRYIPLSILYTFLYVSLFFFFFPPTSSFRNELKSHKNKFLLLSILWRKFLASWGNCVRFFLKMKNLSISKVDWIITVFCMMRKFHYTQHHKLSMIYLMANELHSSLKEKRVEKMGKRKLFEWLKQNFSSA